MIIIVECTDCGTVTRVPGTDGNHVDETVECSHCNARYAATITRLQ